MRLILGVIQEPKLALLYVGLLIWLLFSSQLPTTPRPSLNFCTAHAGIDPIFLFVNVSYFKVVGVCGGEVALVIGETIVHVTTYLHRQELVWVS